MTRAEALVGETLRYLVEMEPGLRTDLLAALRVPPDRTNRALAQRVNEAVLTGDGAATLLAELSPAAHALLDRLVLAGEQASLHAILYGEHAIATVLPAGEVYRGVIELRRHGLCRERFSAFSDTEVLPPLAAVVLEPALARVAAPLAAPVDAAPPWAFRLAVAAAVFASDEPALTKSGQVHAAALTKLAKRLEASAPWVRRLPDALPTLRRLGCLKPVGAGSRVVLALDAAQAEDALATPPLSLALASLPMGEGVHLHVQALAHLRAVAGRQPTGTASVLELAAAPIAVPRKSSWADHDPRLDAWQLVMLLLDLVDHGLAERASAPGEPLRLRPATPPQHGTGRWVVQPSLEVLVGWDVAPARVARLAAVADLEVADRVCRYRLTRTSVLRGVRLLGGGDAVVKVLEEGSGAPVAQNVAATVAGWAGQERVLRPVKGDVIVADGPELRALVARAAPRAREIAPGVFLLPPDGLAAIGKRAKQEGVTVAPTRVAEDETAAGPRLVRAPTTTTAVRADAAQRVLKLYEDAARTPPTPKPPEPRRDDLTAAIATHIALLTATRPTTTDRPSVQILPPPASVAPPLPPTWIAPLPGVLRLHLEAAVARRARVELLYLLDRQAPVEMLVEPRAVRDVAGRAWLDAFDVRGGEVVPLALDRVTSIRAAAPA